MPTPGIFDVVGQLSGCSKVVQLVASTYNVNVDTNTPEYVATGLSATITPTSEDNKILILVFQNGLRKNRDTYGALRLMNTVGATLAFLEAAFGFNGLDNENNVGGSGIAYLDSPASTDPQTYSTEFNCSPLNTNGTTSVNHNSATSSMLLVEVLP